MIRTDHLFQIYTFIELITCFVNLVSVSPSLAVCTIWNAALLLLIIKCVWWSHPVHCCHAVLSSRYEHTHSHNWQIIPPTQSALAHLQPSVAMTDTGGHLTTHVWLTDSGPTAGFWSGRFVVFCSALRNILPDPWTTCCRSPWQHHTSPKMSIFIVFEVFFFK